MKLEPLLKKFLNFIDFEAQNSIIIVLVTVVLIKKVCIALVNQHEDEK